MIQKPVGPPMMQITIKRDAAGSLNIDAWTKDVSAAGIILGNQRGAAPIEIMSVLANILANMMTVTLKAAQDQAKQIKGGLVAAFPIDQERGGTEDGNAEETGGSPIKAN